MYLYIYIKKNTQLVLYLLKKKMLYICDISLSKIIQLNIFFTFMVVHLKNLTNKIIYTCITLILNLSTCE